MEGGQDCPHEVYGSLPRVQRLFAQGKRYVLFVYHENSELLCDCGEHELFCTLQKWKLLWLYGNVYVMDPIHEKDLRRRVKKRMMVMVNPRKA